MNFNTARRQIVRFFLRFAVLLIAFVALRVAYTRVAGSRGLLSPDINIDMKLVALFAALWLSRTALIVWLPFEVVYRLTSAATTYWANRRAK